MACKWGNFKVKCGRCGRNFYWSYQFVAACPKCKEEIAREYAKKSRSKWTPQRHNCLKVYVKAIRDGILPSLIGVKCVDCGKDAQCYDHRDYSKPLEVDPVCKSCNALRGPAKFAFIEEITK